jgi:predicted RNase H-like nuclease (RuvC/YqgF family)
VYRTRNPKGNLRSQKRKKGRSLDGRISELTSKLKTAGEERLKLERELEELRKGGSQP